MHKADLTDSEPNLNYRTTAIYNKVLARSKATRIRCQVNCNAR